MIIELFHCSIYATGNFSVEGRGGLVVGLVGLWRRGVVWHCEKGGAWRGG